MLKNTRNRINARLKMLYDMMPECDCMGDVGTDHGFLPIYCVINGKCKSAVASDLREGPLKIAQKNILLHHCEKQIQTRLCSGLKEYRAQECDVVVIAGMGGFTICNILAEWLDQSAQEKYFPGDDEDARQNRQKLYPCSKTFERQSDGCVKKIFRSSCRTEKTYG